MAAFCSRPRRAAEAPRSRAAKASTTATEAATSATGVAAWPRRSKSAWARRTARPAIFAGARLTDRQWAAHEKLAIELLDGRLGGGAFRVLDERKTAGATGFPIEGTHDLRRLTDLREMRTQVVFGCLIRQVAYEQSDWWHC
jgi:hypothetical protein